MRKSIAAGIITALCSTAALLPASTASLAQVDSPGGMIGQRGKSASGSACGDVAGKWLWKWFNQTNIVTLNADGTGTNDTLRAKSTWTCVDRMVVIRWPLSKDTVVLSSDGNTLTGSSMPLGNAVSGSRL